MPQAEEQVLAEATGGDLVAQVDCPERVSSRSAAAAPTTSSAWSSSVLGHRRTKPTSSHARSAGSCTTARRRSTRPHLRPGRLRGGRRLGELAATRSEVHRPRSAEPRISLAGTLRIKFVPGTCFTPRQPQLRLVVPNGRLIADAWLTGPMVTASPQWSWLGTGPKGHFEPSPPDLGHGLGTRWARKARNDKARVMRASVSA